MVQQNLVEYILSQLRQGKRLEDINKFLLGAGYNKAEVESSVQYVINLQTSPQLAEQQRIQQLSGYIATQVKAGYDQQAIANFLISRGYPYYEVNSALQQATLPKKEVKVEHKLVVFALIAMFVMTAAVTVMYFKAYTIIGIGVPEQLLDVEAQKLTTIVQQGGELSFQVKLINFGYEKRFDVELKYQVIDRETQGAVLEKTETLALSTTLENIVKFDIPETLKAGKYVLRVDATYKDFTATAGFIFDILAKDIAKEKLEEIRKELPKAVNETIPELAPNVTVPTKPEDKPTPIKKVPEKKFYEGLTRQQAFAKVKAISVRDPTQAAEMCKTLPLSYHVRDCIMTIAKFKKDALYCTYLEKKDKDTCLFEIIISQQQYALCDQISDANLAHSCKMMSAAGQTTALVKSNQAEDAADALQKFGLSVTALPNTTYNQISV